MATRYVITLVHGTWTDTKGWVAAGSFLRRALEQSIPNVVFREFSWTSTNTHAARTEAGARLSHFIRAGHAQYPNARHFIVAHSHGGNVALYAMRDPAARAVVQGIVTLGTPFINVRRRAAGRYADAIAWLMLGTAALLSFLLIDSLNLAWGAFGWLVSAVALTVSLKPGLSQRLRDTATRAQSDVDAALQAPPIDPSKLVVLCARGDEAGRWLRT